MPLFETTLLSFCKTHSKLDLPTLRQGSRERKNATEQIKNMKLDRIFFIFFLCSVALFLSLLPFRSVGMSNFDWGLHKLSNVDSNNDIQI